VTALAGYWSFGNRHDPAQACTRMLRAQQIYAPDPPALQVDDEVSLGRRLFRLLPEDRYDRGPVVGADGSMLVADLRLDNRDELCGQLGIAAAEARMLADAAILMRALERWGEETPQHLLGDFAFAWWSRARGRLVLARDFVGQRPLHYHRGDGFFALASMPKGLLALPDIPNSPNGAAMAQALALMPETGSETFFSAVEKVVPGEVLVVTPGGVSARRHWNPTRTLLRLNGPEEYAEALREQMDRAVLSRLRGADGRLASHLSAGLDSSTVTATAARLLGQTGGAVTAFTSVPREGYEEAPAPESFIDEWPLAASVAAQFANVDHVKMPSTMASPLGDIERKFFAYDRPLVNPCNHVWYSAIMDEAKRRRLPVLLTGQMGNGSISYDGMAFLTHLLRQGRLVRLAREARHLRRHGTRWGSIGAQAIGPFLPKRVWTAIQRRRGGQLALSDYSAIGEEAEASLRERAAERGLDFVYRPRKDAFETRLWMFRRVDLGNFNKGDLGLWGIDVRDPTADRRLVEFCLSVPVEQFLSKGSRRALARRAFADRLPRPVVEERRKGHQAPDWHEALTAARAEIRSDIERLAECKPAAEMIDFTRLGKLAEEWPEDGWNKPKPVRQYRLALLRGVGVGRFARWASGGNA
jgi:asparagine synthase (glutamine-hydrolysing)